MNARYLLDTNICIYLRRGRPKSVLQRFARLVAGEAAMSVVTYGELAFGVEKSQRRAEAEVGFQQLREVIQVLPLPQGAGRAYGTLRAKLEFEGRTLGSNDLWIAAHAVEAKLILVTNNEREFVRVPNLTIENWARDG